VSLKKNGVLPVFVDGTGQGQAVVEAALLEGDWMDGNNLELAELGMNFKDNQTPATQVSIICDIRDFNNTATKGRAIFNLSNENYFSTNSFLVVRPNPFQSSTLIRYSGQEIGSYVIRIYDLSGRFVREISGTKNTSPETVSWDGKDFGQKTMPEGLYYLEMKIGQYNDKKIMVKIR
jgi:hypothetical protein